jgi:N-acetylglucosaminyldiphosphoundecaprenol N-acetyl-beta-D-mannosaminyltransferase
MDRMQDAVEMLGIPVSARDMASAIELVTGWVKKGDRARCVTFSNAHVLALSTCDENFRSVMKSMDLNCADGMPIVLAIRTLYGISQAGHIPGPDFMAKFCMTSATRDVKHFILGCGPGIAASAAANLVSKNPGLQIVGTFNPPYREASDEELAEQYAMIRDSGADVVWVALGCPKQEIWLSRAREHLHGKVLLAVGQAVDIHAQSVERAPLLMRRLSLEWLYRLAQDPQRLWRRYLIYNSIFLLRLAEEFVQRLMAKLGRATASANE